MNPHQYISFQKEDQKEHQPFEAVRDRMYTERVNMRAQILTVLHQISTTKSMCYSTEPFIGL